MNKEKARNFLSKKEQEEVINAIKVAEKNTSGEIRVHIEYDNESNEEDRTLELFKKLEMHQTKDRNAVLFHFCISEKSLAIYGDKGIHGYVKQEYWNNLRDEMIQHFKESKFKEGLVNAILKTGEKLKNYFPYQEDDKNELSDEISFS
ncbi:MAG: TPM domain-containing protein [Flavobacteriales bacterium]|nr:TPM domain-containing protein [Flavobacteriales bacterium]